MAFAEIRTTRQHATPAQQVMALPFLQKLALLRTIESHTSRMMQSRLRNAYMDVRTPGTEDYTSLVAIGLMERPAGYRLHRPTEAGRAAAQTLLSTLWNASRLSREPARKTTCGRSQKWDRW